MFCCSPSEATRARDEIDENDHGGACFHVAAISLEKHRTAVRLNHSPVTV
jgi:hypothetical protein